MRDLVKRGSGAVFARLLHTGLGLGFLLVTAGTLQGQNAGPANAGAGPSIPAVEATALDGHAVSLPAALPGRATVLILGFGKHSADATTAWEKVVRTQLAQPPSIGFFDMAMVAEVPSFVRPMVLRSIRKDVPDVLKPNFLPLFDHEEDWKHVAGYAADQPEAAYIMVVDQAGNVRWSTHEPFSQAAFARLREAAQHVQSR